MKYRNFHIYELLSNLKGIPSIFFFPIIIRTFFKNISIYDISFIYILCILFSSVFIFTQIFSYLNFYIKEKNKTINIKKGIFIKNKFIIPTKNINSLIIKQNLLNKILGVYKTFISSVKSKNVLYKGLYLTKKQALNIENCFLGKNYFTTIYKINFKYFIILLLSYYSISSGLLLTIPLIKKLEKSLAENFNIKQDISINYKITALNINSIINPFIITAIFCFLLTLIIQIIRFWGLSIKLGQGITYIEKGVILNSKSIIKNENIYCLSNKITALSFIFKISFFYIHMIKNKENYKKLLSAVINKNYMNHLSSLILGPTGKKIYKLAPPKNTFKNYIILPILIEIFLFLIGTFSPYYIRYYLIPILLIINSWWIIIRIHSFQYSSIILYQNLIYLSGHKGLSIFECFITYKKLNRLVIKQSPFQKISKKCNVYFFWDSNTRDFFKVKHINLEDIKKLVEHFESLYNSL